MILAANFFENARTSKNLIRRFLLGAFFLGFQLEGYSQSCNCPPLNECGPCQGGLVSLTLRYDGLYRSYIEAEDDDETLYAGWVDPGETFTVTRSESDGKFDDNELDIDGSGIQDVEINTSCGSGVYVNSTYGNFTIVAAASKNGGSLCCSGGPPAPDNIPPNISNCPASITIPLGLSGCSTIVDWVVPTATDVCGISTFSSSHIPGVAFELGTTLVTYTATDIDGNIASCSFNVIVIDNTNPVITGCPSDVRVSANSTCKANVTWPAPSASDNCSLSSFTSTHPSGFLFSLGTTGATYTATDGSGRTSTCTFNVIVTDNINPVITGCPSNMTVVADALCTGTVSWTSPTVTDNCGSATLTSTHNSGTTFPMGTTQVTYTAKDGSGSTSTCTFNVVVKNQTLPIISNCPKDFAVKSNEVGVAVVDWTSPTATAPCDNVILISSKNSGATFPIGISEVEYKATDKMGNVAYCTFNVLVSPMDIDVDISRVVTPDGDGINDEWILMNIEKFKNNAVVIVDRWGGVVFDASGYNNENIVWRGTNLNGINVPTGTYFYTISVSVGPSKSEKTGFIEMIR